jgi:hypothetical protein
VSLGAHQVSAGAAAGGRGREREGTQRVGGGRATGSGTDRHRSAAGEGGDDGAREGARVSDRCPLVPPGTARAGAGGAEWEREGTAKLRPLRDACTGASRTGWGGAAPPARPARTPHTAHLCGAGGAPRRARAAEASGATRTGREERATALHAATYGARQGLEGSCPGGGGPCQGQGSYALRGWQ